MNMIPSIEQLPSELLRHIFCHLDAISDKSQCQRTCRKWCQPAKETIYRRIIIGDEGTIYGLKNNGYLTRDIYFDITIYDDDDHLTTIADHCPNLMSIKTGYFQTSTAPIYNKITHHKDQFQKLEYIPDPMEPRDIIPYRQAALALQNTIRKVTICDELNHGQQQQNKANLEFETSRQLLSEVNLFKRLEELTIRHHTHASIVDLDSIIQSSNLSLKSLDVEFYNSNTQHSSINLKQVIPRLGIETFRANWNLFVNDQSLTYLIHKFPNLCQFTLIGNDSCRSSKYQKVRLGDTNKFSNYALSAFFTYIYKMKRVVLVECGFIKRDVIDLLPMVLSSFGSRAAVSVEYRGSRVVYDPTLTLKKNPYTKPTTNGFDMTATVAYYLDLSSILQHVKLIETTGSSIQQLEISGLDLVQKLIKNNIQEKEEYNLIHGYWIDHILKKCPSLRILKISKPGLINMDPTNTEKYINISQLYLNDVQPTENNMSVYQDLSVRIPRLDHLEIFQIENYGDKGNLVTVYMPHTSINTFLWHRRRNNNKFDVFHLKVTIQDFQPFYFIGNCKTNDLHKSSSEAYDKAVKLLVTPNTLLFDIRCTGIKCLWIRMNDIDKPFAVNLDTKKKKPNIESCVTHN